MNINIVLTSTVVAAIISGLFNVIFNLIKLRKSTTLEYITHERKEWREKIREIAIEIQSSSNRDELLKILSRLKMNINAYGINQKENFLKDGHIWEIIEEMESNLVDEEKAKNKLLNYLSLLIKYDWDRAKIEAKGNIQIHLSFVFLIINLFLCITLFYFQNPDILKNGGIITIIIIKFISIGLTYLPSLPMFMENHINGKRNIFLISIISLIITIGVDFLFSAITCFAYLSILIIIDTFVIGLACSHFIEVPQSDSNYIKAVKSIKDSL